MTITSITLAGHAAVFLGTDKGSIAIDPWIEGNPAVPEGFKVPSDLSLIVLTHGHSDHAADAPRLCKDYGCMLAATFELAMLMGREGVPAQHLVPMNRGGTWTFNGIRISLTTAFHSSSWETPQGFLYAGEACGAVIDDGTTCVYHSGDTCLFSDMKLIRETYHPTHALLPIGDHFTMGPKEAAQAAAFVGARVAIPMHYKTFDVLSGSPEDFKTACNARSIEVIQLAAGETLAL